MLANLSISCLVLLAFALLASAAPTLPPVRVPYIRLDGYELTPTDFGYHLSLTKPDGTWRVEEATGQLSVSGNYNEIYGNRKSEVNYKADKNGYVAKYHFGTTTQPPVYSFPAPAPEPAPAPNPDPYKAAVLRGTVG